MTFKFSLISSIAERVGHEGQVQELVLGGGSQLVVTEVRKSKLFILLGLVDMTDRSMSRLKVIPIKRYNLQQM